MKKFNEKLNNILQEVIKPFEDYSSTIKRIKSNSIQGNCFEYVNCENHCIISEDGLSRTLNIIKNSDFAIITAYRNKYTKMENILRNRKLRKILNDNKIGVHQLVGHWQEAPDGKRYIDCDKSELKDVVERSYLVQRPNNLSFKNFEQIILNALTIDGDTQDAAIIKNEKGIFLIYHDGTYEKIGDHCTLGKINQAYSQHVKNKTPFVFEGIEIPASNLSKQIYTTNNILY